MRKSAASFFGVLLFAALISAFRTKFRVLAVSSLWLCVSVADSVWESGGFA